MTNENNDPQRDDLRALPDGSLIDPGGTTPHRTVAGVEYATDDLDGGLNINHLFVPPTDRREGRGGAVLTALVAEAARKGYEYVVVNMAGGDPAAAFLREHGFDVVERTGDRMTAERDLPTSTEMDRVDRGTSTESQ